METAKEQVQKILEVLPDSSVLERETWFLRTKELVPGTRSMGVDIRIDHPRSQPER